MNRLLKILLKELLFYIIISGVVLLFYATVINNLIWKILSIITILLGKYYYEIYIAKFYSENKNDYTQKLN